MGDGAVRAGRGQCRARPDRVEAGGRIGRVGGNGALQGTEVDGVRRVERGQLGPVGDRGRAAAAQPGGRGEDELGGALVPGAGLGAGAQAQPGRGDAVPLVAARGHDTVRGGGGSGVEQFPVERQQRRTLPRPDHHQMLGGDR
ncbi:hypothetical protein SDC9_120429 [bioreactor metagenome]|uniref:Uncharacterized protein n=1 Tax=bioreactor metagenome TaxID=1076179 RepID=A0A645C724_9ZZZZ